MLALAFGVWWFHFKPKHAVAAYKQQLIAAGEKLEIDELIPPPVAPEQNGADLFYQAAALLNSGQNVLETNLPPAMRMVAPGKAMVGWGQPAIRDAKATNSWDEVEAALAKLGGGLSALEQLIDRQTIDFRLDYHQGFTLMLPNLAPLKRAAQRLSAATLCASHRGDAESAVAHVRAMLALVRGSSHERLVISQLVRIAVAAITVNATWELLQSADLTDKQLAILQQDWAQLDFIQPTEAALAMERAMGNMTIGQMRESSAEFNKLVSAYGAGSGPGSGSSSGDWFEQVHDYGKEAWDRTKASTREVAWRVAWSYPDQLRALKGHQVLIETARQVRSNGNYAAALALQKQRLEALGFREEERDQSGGMSAGDLDLQSLFSQGVVSLNRLVRRVMLIETSKQMVVTAIALKRYKLQHGSYPAELKALAPEFLPVLPHDPVNGEPLHYQLKADGSFQLYSVGEDGVDNGGEAKPKGGDERQLAWQRGQDWVWPQPASENEIADYYSKLSRKP